MTTVEDRFQPLRREALSDLARLVDTNSFTGRVDGLQAAAQVLSEIAGRNGIHLKRIPAGGGLRGAYHLVSDAPLDRPFFGILGHFDTVHPPESPFARLIDEGDRLVGPGVQDMKSGIVAALYGLRIAREALGVDRLPVQIVFNCDEETGSTDSRTLIERVMKGARAAFVFEGRNVSDNALVASRKGIIMGRMVVRGKAAHAGEAPHAGASAIVEAAHKIAALDTLTDLERGLVVTTGTVAGGTVANQIPDRCEASIDIRFRTPEDEWALKEAVQRIMKKSHVPGCTTRWALDTVRPPFVKSNGTEELVRRYAAAAEALGIRVSEREAGGGSDGNLTSAIGVPTLDGMGPAGDFAHTDREYIRKASFFDAVTVFALLLIDMMGH